MKKKNILNFSLILLILVILISSILFCVVKFTNIFDKTVNREVIVSENGLSEGIENVYDSVVVVENYKYNSNESSGTGTGFIISEEGYIITNQHVIKDAKYIKVTLTNGNIIDADLIGEDEYDDIAVLKIDSKYVTKVAKIGSSDNAKLGDTVFAIGTPMSSKYAGTITRGIISGKDRLVEVSVNSNTNDWIMKVIQTDVSLNPGNSGGPLCDISGNVIGVNTMKISNDEIDGIGFAIPIEDAMDLANKLISGNKINRPYLGITMSDISSSLKKYDINLDKNITSGVVVIEVYENSSCERSGILKGDVIVSIGKYSTKNVAELKYYLSKYESGEEIDIEVIRNNEHKKMKLVLDERD